MYDITGTNKNRIVRVFKQDGGFYPIFLVNLDQVAHTSPSKTYKTEKGFAKKADKFLNK